MSHRIPQAGSRERQGSAGFPSLLAALPAHTSSPRSPPGGSEPGPRHRAQRRCRGGRPSRPAQLSRGGGAGPTGVPRSAAPGRVPPPPRARSGSCSAAPLPGPPPAGAEPPRAPLRAGRRSPRPGPALVERRTAALRRAPLRSAATGGNGFPGAALIAEKVKEPAPQPGARPPAPLGASRRCSAPLLPRNCRRSRRRGPALPSPSTRPAPLLPMGTRSHGPGRPRPGAAGRSALL